MTSGFNDARIKSTMDKAEDYTTRRAAKHQAEMDLVKKAFLSLNNVKKVLDAPCGIGRATFLLAQMGYDATGVDAGEAAIIKAKELAEKDNIQCTLMEANLKQTPFEDGTFDAVLCFRFFHHLLTSEARQHIVDELTRISNQYVLISYLSPVSVTSWKRKLRVMLGGRKSSQETTPLSEIKGYFDQAGYELVKDFAQTPLLHTLHLAVFKPKA